MQFEYPPQTGHPLTRMPLTIPTHEHDTLHKQINEIEAALLRRNRQEIMFQLRRFYHMLVLHIRAEDTEDGFYGEVERMEPRLISTLELLRRQHREILGRLEYLLASKEIDFEEIDKRCQKLFRLMERHERAEDRVIQEVYYQDIGFPSGSA